MKISTKRKIWAFWMRQGNRYGCHQREDRSFSIKGWQFPVCSRCAGILLGQILAVVLFLLRITIPLYIDLLFLFMMFLDWYIQYKKIRESTNTRRIITGTLAGIAQVSMLAKIVLFLFSLC